MYSLELKYSNWEREDNYEMYDYSSQKNAITQLIKIKYPCKIYRHRKNYTLKCMPIDSEEDSADWQCLVVIRVSDSHFFLVSLQKYKWYRIRYSKKNGKGSNEIIKEIDFKPDLNDYKELLCRIIAYENQGYSLAGGEHLKLGKVQVQIERIHWRKVLKNNHYEDRPVPFVTNKQRRFSSSFYEDCIEESASLVYTNPSCRYCFSKTVNNINPFVAACNCSGSAQYIHYECLIEWIRRRNDVDVKYHAPGLYCTLTKALTCELCNSMYSLDNIVQRIFDLVPGYSLKEHMILHVLSYKPVAYVVGLSALKQIVIGRHFECDIIINELSVSRRHCRIEIDYERREVRLYDYNAKFGTVVEIYYAELSEEKEEYQKGRTKMYFRKVHKRSFFEKIGFCSPQEDLKSERKKL